MSGLRLLCELRSDGPEDRLLNVMMLQNDKRVRSTGSILFPVRPRASACCRSAHYEAHLTDQQSELRQDCIYSQVSNTCHCAACVLMAQVLRRVSQQQSGVECSYLLHRLPTASATFSMMMMMMMIVDLYSALRIAPLLRYMSRLVFAYPDIRITDIRIYQLILRQPKIRIS